MATDNLTATVSVLHGKLTVATNSGATVSNDNSNNVVITGSTAQINAALEGLVYAPLLDYNGADTLTLLTSDNGNTDHSDLAHPASAITPLTVTKTVNLSVTAVNDAPVASGSSTLAAILEDDTNPVGASVSALFQANFSDSKDQLKPTGYSDANTFAGIGIIGYMPDSNAGSWQYKIDNGEWTTIESALSLSKALTLKITDSLRFVPVADYNGTPPALTVLLIDNSIDFVTSGESSYARKEVGVLGGASPYSSGTVSLTTNIIPVNDNPSFANGVNQIVKEDAGEQTVANFITNYSKGPSNESYQSLTFIITNSNNTLFSVQPSINSSGTLTYTPALNANGAATVTVSLNDSENGTTGTQTFTITVQPVNDAPTQTVPVAQSVDEDSSLTLSHFSVSDELDTKQAATDNLTTTLTVQHGKLTASTATGNDSDSISITGSAAQINAALNGLIYKPNANYNGKDSLTVLTSDNGNTGGGALSVSNTIEITVNPVNDAPVITSKETISSVAENSPLETIVYTVSATDIDEGQKLSYSLSGQDANSFVIDATTGVVTLKAAANFEVKNSYQFNVVATDDDKKPLSDVKAITINVTDVDEAPVAVSDGYKTNEDTALKIAATQGVLAKSSAANANSQLSAILVKNPANGTLILEKNGAFTYQPNPNYSGVDSFTYKASDGKLDSDLVVVSLTVQPVNDAPSFKIGENQKVQSIAGKQTVTEWASEINAGINESDQVVSFQVTNDNEALFSLQPTIDNTGTLTYTPAEGANGSATIRVLAKDNGGIDNTGIDTSAEQSAVIVIESLTNAAPILTSATTFELPEKTTAIATITASDKDGDLLNYSLAGGTNQDLFTLDSATGNLAFKTPVLFDTKPDSTNSYNVSVSVSDGKVSDTQNLTITVLPDLDSDGKADKYDDDIDGDGILNIAEDKIPNPSGGNFGDANSDGILDSYQPNVGAIKTIANDKNGSPRYAAFSVAEGLSIQNITNSVAKNLPKGTTLPLGAFGLTVGNVPIGGDATITMTVSPDVVMNGYLKQNNTGQWVKLPITLGGDTTKTISFTLTDGGIFDKDGVKNGTIVDPGGPTVLANVPLLAQFTDTVKTLAETDSILTTSGKLTSTNAEKFTVTAQNVTGLFGSFSIDGAGNWSYTTDTAHNEFLKDKIYTDTFTVKTTDGVVSNVAINITGTRDLPIVVNDMAKQTIETTTGVNAQKILHGQITLQTTQGLNIVQNADKSWTDLDGIPVSFSLDNAQNVGTNLVKTTLTDGSTLTLNTLDGSYTYTPNTSKNITNTTDIFKVTVDSVPLTLSLNRNDLLDRDGIPDTVETNLANLANAASTSTTKPSVSGDLNGDGIADKQQGAVTDIAWMTNKDFNAGLNNTLTSTKPIVSIVIASYESGAADSSAQLSNVSVLSSNSSIGKPKSTATTGNIKTPWDALQFSIASTTDKGLKDINPNNAGTQTLVKIDISRSGETNFNGYMKYVSADTINAYKNAGLPLVTLDGEALTMEKQAGWYDFTQRSEGGDGAKFIKDASGKITDIEIVITDNQFGDDDIASNQITDPSLPVVLAVPIAKTLESSTDVTSLAAEFTNLTLQETLIDKKITTTQLVDNPLACLPEWTLKLLNIPLKINQDVTTTTQVVAPLNGTGNALANQMVGNSADNILNGLAGADTLTGGLGADTFVFGDKDVITDFNFAQGDKIDIRGANFVRFDSATQTLHADTNGDGKADATLQLLGVSSFPTEALITK
ncbi:MAG: Ig-like domain-containing protein [Methylococcales bacterium]|nr:Ig-like domain-containing protein [Methylococcales bacterium]